MYICAPKTLRNWFTTIDVLLDDYILEKTRINIIFAVHNIRFCICHCCRQYRLNSLFLAFMSLTGRLTLPNTYFRSIRIQYKTIFRFRIMFIWCYKRYRICTFVILSLWQLPTNVMKHQVSSFAFCACHGEITHVYHVCIFNYS